MRINEIVILVRWLINSNDIRSYNDKTTILKLFSIDILCMQAIQNTSVQIFLLR
jgi:hypothetical protein